LQGMFVFVNNCKAVLLHDYKVFKKILEPEQNFRPYNSQLSNLNDSLQGMFVFAIARHNS